MKGGREGEVLTLSVGWVGFRLSRTDCPVETAESM
jgi:hypothetical protein